MGLQELEHLQGEKYKNFVQHLIKNSEFYKLRLENIIGADNRANLEKIPILEKEELKQNLSNIMIRN